MTRGLRAGRLHQPHRWDRGITGGAVDRGRGSGPGAGRARAPGSMFTRCPFHSTKEPFQRLMCPTRDTVWPIRSCSRPPKHTTKAWDTCTGCTALPPIAD